LCYKGEGWGGAEKKTASTERVACVAKKRQKGRNESYYTDKTRRGKDEAELANAITMEREKRREKGGNYVV
jgi:hypothetical protein